MRSVFLILAAAAAVAALPAPAAAERRDAGVSNHRSGQSAASGVRIHRGHGDWRDRRDRGDRDRRFRGDAYLPYRDYQGDTLWGSGGFNDWWHDRPDRAFPRWLAANHDCERRYWAGGAWRC